jgi:hypothetical protein
MVAPGESAHSEVAAAEVVAFPWQDCPTEELESGRVGREERSAAAVITRTSVRGRSLRAPAVMRRYSRRTAPIKLSPMCTVR